MWWKSGRGMLRMRNGGAWHQTPGEEWKVDRGIDWSSRALGCPRHLFQHWMIHSRAWLDGGNECERGERARSGHRASRGTCFKSSERRGDVSLSHLKDSFTPRVNPSATLSGTGLVPTGEEVKRKTAATGKTPGITRNNKTRSGPAKIYPPVRYTFA